DRLLLGSLDEAARVDDDQVGRPRVHCPTVPSGQQQLLDRLGVHGVFGAPERNDVKGPQRRHVNSTGSEVGCAGWRAPLTVISVAEPLLARKTMLSFANGSMRCEPAARVSASTCLPSTAASTYTRAVVRNSNRMPSRTGVDVGTGVGSGVAVGLGL